MLGVLKGCLCCSYRTYEPCEFTIWMMKEYGIGNSWQKEVVINQSICPNLVLSWLTFQGSLKDGCILMMYDPGNLLVYCPDTRTFEETRFADVDAISYRPSFLKLQNFESESVYNFPSSQDDAGVVLNTNGEMDDVGESFCVCNQLPS
ncbi:uncharacterized protein [Rutidosis leptorrhynchoides]|uniref:uncharacterized protein n=1 Tax=Rutidosis leptorrhynchoides TaxID=125765 RepID=UPI003A9A1579